LPATGNDCTTSVNGVTFTLDHPDPNETDLMTMTGDSVDGAVYFGGLEAGNYTVSETVPADIASVFVLDCENALDGMVRPVPFSTGDTLELPISGYEETITCDWYNVPTSPHGQVTVIKYNCTTETFVSEVDCEIYEHGQGFELSWRDGASWVFQADGTTDASGVLTFTDLQPGTWQLDEEDASWCAISSDDLSRDGSSLHV
jgi:uncharacterized surface anchored protein